MVTKPTKKTGAAAPSATNRERAGTVPPPEGPQKADERRIRLDASAMKSSYCNVCNATSTREEVVLNFGINQDWDRPGEEMLVQIQHRIIMSPHAAGKLLKVLSSLIEEHENRHGPLDR